MRPINGLTIQRFLKEVEMNMPASQRFGQAVDGSGKRAAKYQDAPIPGLSQFPTEHPMDIARIL